MSYKEEALNAISCGFDEDTEEETGMSPWASQSLRNWQYAYWARDLTVVRPSSKRRRRALEARMSRMMGLDDLHEDCPLCSDDVAPPPSGVKLRLRPELAPASDDLSHR